MKIKQSLIRSIAFVCRHLALVFINCQRELDLKI